MSRAAPSRGHARNGHRADKPLPGSRLGTAVTELYRGRAYLALLRDLALGEWSYSELAQGLGVPTSEIADFAKENSAQIGEVKQALAGELAIETAGLWITHKHMRLAEIQGDYEDLDREIEAIRKQPATFGEHGSGPGSRHHRELVKARDSLRRAVAEELGERQRTGPKPGDVPPAEPDRVHYAIQVPAAMMEALS